MLVKANTDSSASLNTEQLKQLQQVSQQFTPLQLAWASGYLAAKSENPGNQVAPSAEASTAAKLTILYGSQTGNAKGVASQVESAAKSAGMQVSTFNMADYKGKNLKNESHVLVITSTNGEGEPPDDAIALHEFLGSKRAPKLPNLNYSVLALGDSSYEFFCQTGKDFDEMLSKLGAKALSPRIDCDLDYQQPAKDWQDTVLKDVASQLKATTADVVQLPLESANSSQTSQYSKENPFTATILANQKITGRDSNKVVQHIEIDLSDSGITYQPGDALGIFPLNDKALVADIAALLKLDVSESVSVNDKETSLEQALISDLEITKLNKASIVAWAELADNAELTSLLANAEQLRDLINGVQFIDFAKKYPAKVSAQQLVATLAALTPRLYSIASSQADVEEEVHLTVGLVEYQVGDEQRLGCASGFLIERLQEDDEVRVFIEHNNNFRLPENPETATIMIGPGTGVAPFRAFIQQRSAEEASGKNWLFFGDQTFTQDFLYQVEWQAYLKSGELSRMDVAFSRDQAEKIYVQDKLKAQGSEVFAWLESGAHLYICGDMSRMAKDVHQALIEIISEHGQKSAEQAQEYLKQLRINKRYQKDVY
ncbi:assimilatory sulfite reductase (NADPH) flavoprotein subunit [Thalassomonas sp. M1454]|uniref:assimilatory sulfite reductase (NADPH) flavoprotein subunit n=1 Tax=Thalassomonas sp. M1454 TaxID=2594477 RepID=UPI00117FE6B0|nr:assimilatory sulfite reductase (NADPH) flavoprotein subunit [Thalassomonas sp. M1454]TRX53484.1 assimilatory sulfite reductase (NADPH) flavoprotein subunit [Thalassomonas sp. M1454]